MGCEVAAEVRTLDHPICGQGVVWEAKMQAQLAACPGTPRHMGAHWTSR